MKIKEKIISILELGSGFDKKEYTEEQMEGFARNTFASSIGAFILPFLILFVFHYAPKAKKSSNKKTVEKATRGENIGFIYVLGWFLIMIYVLMTN